MKYLKGFLFVIVMLANLSGASAQDQEMQFKMNIQLDLRTAFWPNWRTVSGHFTGQNGQQIPLYTLDPEIDEYLSSEDFKNAARGIVDRNYEQFSTAWKNTSDSMKKFFMSEIDVRTGQTPFHYLTLNSNGDEESAVKILETICSYAEIREVEVYGYVYKGVNTNDYLTGGTALLYAVRNREYKLSNALIECNADVNGANVMNGLTPLMQSAKVSDVDTFFTLINNGADSKSLDLKGRTVFYYYNLGKLESFKQGLSEEESDSIIIREWLEANGHNFNEEALIDKLGFSDHFDITLEKSVLLTGKNLSPEYADSVEIEATSEDLARLRERKVAMEAELLSQCTYLGYANCSVVEDGKAMQRESISTKPISLNLRSSGETRGVLVYKNIYVLVRVLGHKP